MAAGMDGDGPPLPLFRPWYRGKGLGEPPERCSRNLFRIELTNAAGM